MISPKSHDAPQEHGHPNFDNFDSGHSRLIEKEVVKMELLHNVTREQTITIHAQDLIKAISRL